MLFPMPPLPAAPPRVVVTGAGIVTALGIGWTANASGFRLGRTAFRRVTLFDVERQRAKLAAEVDLPAALPSAGVSIRHAARLDRAGRMLCLAAQEAWRQTGWENSVPTPLVLGTTAGGMSVGEAYFRSATQTPHRHRSQPSRALHYQAQIQGRVVADILGSTGTVLILSNACASGASAIGHAWELLRRGQVQRVLAGGYDALCQFVFSGFDSLQALSPTICRPFDAHRDGLTIGEGAAVLALETLDLAARRDASILGELIGYGAALDLHHLTQPHPEGDAALAAMRLACAAARLAPADVDYVNAHGTGTALNDSAEALAIHRWAGDYALTLPVSSTKAGIGHLLGGAGAAGAVVCLMALCGQWLPPQTTLETPDPACRLAIVREPRDARLKIALSNSFGFGGVNATLIFRSWP